ncbi:MAG: LOG family protein [Candidatus Acidiferrum sp.]
MNDERIVTVFGSSRPGEGDADYAQARELGRRLAERGFAVCSGGYGGVMEAASRGAKEAGGKTYGVTAEFFGRNVNEWIDVEIKKKTWEERLFELIRVADGFVACKGGTGTLVELAVVWEMLNKSVMARNPFAVLGNFWQPILERVREVEQGPGSSSTSRVWGEDDGNLVHTVATPEEAANYLSEEMKRGK